MSKKPKITSKTKERALAHSRKLFAKKGFEATSMSEIARMSGIEKASLYYFFQSKEQLFAEVLEVIWKEASQDLNKLIEKGSKKFPSKGQYLEAILLLVINTFLKAGHTMTKLDTVKNKSSGMYSGMFVHIESMHRHLREFLKASKVKDPELAEEVLANSIHSYVIHAQCIKPKVSPKKYVQYLSQLFINN